MTDTNGSMKLVVVALTVALILSILALAWANNDPLMPVTLLFLPLGALGAGLRELQMTLKGESVTRKIEYFKEKGTYATAARLLMGSILAVGLLALCASGLVKGYLFPEFTSNDNAFTNLRDYMQGEVRFAKNVDVSKAFVWVVIAGYSQDWVLTLFAGARDKIGQDDKKDAATP